MKTIEETLNYIHSVCWKGSRPGLSRTIELMNRLGNPQDTLKFVHIAGTNGKGSTASMLMFDNEQYHVCNIGDSPIFLLRQGQLVVDLAAVTVQKNGVTIEVTQKEFDLLTCLFSSPGKVYSREELMEKVWNYDYFGDMRTVDVTVRRLREKIEDDPSDPKYIRTKRGAGYYSGE